MGGGPKGKIGDGGGGGGGPFGGSEELPEGGEGGKENCTTFKDKLSKKGEKNIESYGTSKQLFLVKRKKYTICLARGGGSGAVRIQKLTKAALPGKKRVPPKIKKRGKGEVPSVPISTEVGKKAMKEEKRLGKGWSLGKGGKRGISNENRGPIRKKERRGGGNLTWYGGRQNGERESLEGGG